MMYSSASEPTVGPESTVSMRVVRACLYAVEQAGVPRSQVLSAVGLDAKHVECLDDRIARADLARLCEVILDLTGEHDFALRWAGRLNSGALDPLATLVSHSATLAEAMTTLQQLHWILCDDLNFRVLERGEKIEIRCVKLLGVSPRVGRFIAKLVLGGLSRRIRTFRPNAHFDRVSFDFAEPSNGDEYRRVFGPHVEFGQSFNGLVFERAWMSARSPVRDADLHDALRAFTERRISHLTRGAAYGPRVRDLLVRHGSPRQADMRSIARELGISERSLRRRLAAEGETYGSVLSSALSIVAKSRLLDMGRTIDETAFELGFADRSGFHRAFKRWTGMTPKSFRDENLRIT